MLSATDIKLLGFTQILELTTRDFYKFVVGRKSLSDDESLMLAQFHAHHVAYEQTINGLLGKNAVSVRDDAMYVGFLQKLSESPNVWTALLQIENSLITTHTKSIESIESAKVAAVIASMITIEARHAAILATMTSTNLSLALDNKESVLVVS